MVRRYSSHIVFVIVAFIAYSMQLSAVNACDIYWNAQSGDWSSALNWSPNQTPTSNLDISVSNGGLATISNEAYARVLEIGSGKAGMVEIVGGSLSVLQNAYVGGSGTGVFRQIGGVSSFNGVSLYSGGVVELNGGTLTTSAINLAGGAFYIGGGTLRAASSLSVSGNVTLTGVNGDATIDTQDYDVVLGSVSTAAAGFAAPSLVKIGGGSLAFNSSYSGSLTLRQGTVKLLNPSSLQNSVVTAAGGNLDLGDLTNVALGGLKGSGNLAFNYGRDVTLNVGYLSKSSEFSGSISGSQLSFIKTGSGTLRISGSNSFSGTVSVSGGVLRLNNSAAFSNATLLTSGGNLSFGLLTDVTFGGLAGSSALVLANDNGEAVNLTVGANGLSSTFAGYLNVSSPYSRGSLIKVGAGTLTLTNNNYVDTVLHEGTVKLLNPSSLQNSVVTAAGGNLDLGDLTNVVLGGLEGSGNLAFNYGRDVTLNVGYLSKSSEFSGTLSGMQLSFIKTGSGTLIVSGSNSFTGTVSVSGGVLRLNNSAAFSNATLLTSSGSLCFGLLTDVTFGGLAGSSALVLANDNGEAVNLTVGANGLSSTFAGYLNVSSPYSRGSLIKVGAGTLTLTNNNNGDTVLREGTVKLLNPSSLQTSVVAAAGGNLDLGDLTNVALGGLEGSGNLAFNYGRNVTLNVGYLNKSSEFSGSISGSQLSFIKTGSGTLIVSGSNSFSGTVSVSGGALRLNNSAAFYNAMLAPSSPGLSFGSLTEATVGGLAGSGALVLTNESGDPVTLTVGRNSLSSTFSGVVNYATGASGVGTLVKVGSGTLTLGGYCFSDIVLREGAIRPGDNPMLQSAVLYAEGGVLNVGAMSQCVLGGLAGRGDLSVVGSNPVILAVGYRGVSTEYFGNLSGATVSLLKIGQGTLALSGFNSFGGTASVSAGVLLLKNSKALANATVQLNGGRLSFGMLDEATFGGLAGGSTLELATAFGNKINLSVGANNVSSVFSGAISGVGGLTKVGAGSLVLAGAISNRGGLSVKAGTLVLTSSESNVASLDVETAAGSVLSITGGTHTLDSVTGSGTTTVSGSAVLTVACLVQDTLILGGSGTSETAAASDATAAGPCVASASVTTAAVPEPTTLLLLAALGGFLSLRAGRLKRGAAEINFTK